MMPPAPLTPLFSAILSVSFVPLLPLPKLPTKTSDPSASPPGSVADMFAVPRPRPELPALPPLRPDVNSLGRDGEGAAPATPFHSLQSLQPGDRDWRKLENKTKTSWGFVKTETILRAPEPTRDAPFERGHWETEDTVNVSMIGPFYLFGQMVLGGEYAGDQEMKIIGRTALLYKIPMKDERAIDVRFGPTVKVADAMRADSLRDEAELWLEVKAVVPVYGPVGLEYVGEALPAYTPFDRPRVRQELGFVVPRDGGKVKLGARHRWQGAPDERAGNADMELFFGVEIFSK
jgi:hypothetical protein